MMSVANSIQAKQQSLTNAINKAERSIDRAITSYKEMERTYSTHILLVILYDDYVRLRDNLSSYFDIVSQTFEKANNAQAK
jgi:predicted phosphoribosyltransferase